MVAGAATLVEILADVLDLLTDDDSPENCALPCFCRVAVYPGLEVAWDTCGEDTCADCDGQLWAAIQSVTRNTTFPAGSGCESFTFTAQIGAVRCAAKPRPDGSPPSVEAVQNDAVRQALDADGILSALKCCPSRSRRIRDAGIVVDSWAPLGPDGGCVGGAWTISGRFDVCC